MKKTVITLAVIISSVIMCSCGNSRSNKENLIHMRDSIQQVNDEYMEWSRQILSQCDSIVHNGGTLSKAEQNFLDGMYKQVECLMGEHAENSVKIYELQVEIDK